jgi:hypothetical protein
MDTEYREVLLDGLSQMDDANLIVKRLEGDLQEAYAAIDDYRKLLIKSRRKWFFLGWRAGMNEAFYRSSPPLGIFFEKSPEDAFREALEENGNGS